jgi:hypothetical protein
MGKHVQYIWLMVSDSFYDNGCIVLLRRFVETSDSAEWSIGDFSDPSQRFWMVLVIGHDMHPVSQRFLVLATWAKWNTVVSSDMDFLDIETIEHSI